MSNAKPESQCPGSETKTVQQTEGGGTVASIDLSDDIRDAKRYRYLRETAYRSRTGQGTGKGYKIEMHFVAPQRDKWPVQHAFMDFDSAVDEAMSSNNDQVLPFRKGDRVRRSALAQRMLSQMAAPLGMDVPQTGTVTGWSRGKYSGCVKVRVDGSRQSEPFKPELWTKA